METCVFLANINHNFQRNESFQSARDELDPPGITSSTPAKSEIIYTCKQCKRCLGMQGEVRKWQRERKKKMVLYKFTRRDEGDDGARNAACAPGANLALGSSLKFPFSIRRENGPRKKKKKRKYRCRPAKREGNECKPVLTSWPSLSLCARRHSYSSRSRYKSYSTGERNFRARS